jgi:PleD family two-component response regulator
MNEISTIRSIANIDQNSKMGEVSLLKKVEELMQFSNDRILLADDEPFCLESMKVLLEKAGFDVVNKLDVCVSGEEMLSLVSSSF